MMVMVMVIFIVMVMVMITTMTMTTMTMTMTTMTTTMTTTTNLLNMYIHKKVVYIKYTFGICLVLLLHSAHLKKFCGLLYALFLYADY